MGNGKKLQTIIMVTAAVVMALAYMVGYFVGKEAGFKEASAKFEVEKRKLLKTLAELNPVSRPIEEKVLKEEQPPKPQETVNSTTTETSQISQTPQVTKEVKKEEKPVNPPASKKVVEAKKVNKKPEPQQAPKKVKKEGKYYVQVGIFRNKANALRLASRLNKKGFNTKTIVTDSYVKVVVGYFETKKEAVETLKKLRKEGIKGLIKRRDA